MQTCFSPPLPNIENGTLDNYAFKCETSAHLNLDAINQGLDIHYTQIDMKELFS